MSDSFKKRGKNFNDFEKALIVELVKEKITTIENKKTDGVTSRAKEKAWEEIAVTFNQTAQTGQRTAAQLHALYITLKKKVKKNKARDRVEMYKTGGGTLDNIGEKIVSMLQHQFEPRYNSFDSSAPLYNQTEENECSSYEIQSADTFVVEIDEAELLNDNTVCGPSTSKPMINNSCPFVDNIQPASGSSESSAARAQSRIKFLNTTPVDLVTSFSKRKELKTNFDREMFQKKMEILNTELETKKNNLEHSKLQLEHSKLQLEHVKIELEIIKHKKLQIMKDTN